MFTIYRGDSNTIPCEMETRTTWRNLTENEVWIFIQEIQRNPAWYGRYVSIRNDDTDEEWSVQEWQYEHC